MVTADFGIVLCAGLGVRLRPLTSRRPKPLIPFLGRPTARYAIDALRSVGVEAIGANAHHLPEQVAELLRTVDAERGESERGLRWEVVVEPQLMGTGGGALGVWQALGAPQASVIVVNGDIVADFPLETMLKTHRRTGAVATMLVIPQRHGESAVYLDESSHFVAEVPSSDGQWRSARYEPAHPVTFGGVYVVEPSVFEQLSREVSCMVRHGLGPMLADGAVIAAHRFDGFWADTGTPAGYFEATRAVLDEPTRLANGPVKSRSDGVYVPDRRSLHPGATLAGPCYVAPGAVVEHGARIGPYAVIGGECRVHSGASVAQSVLMGTADVAGTIHRRLVLDDLVCRLP